MPHATPSPDAELVSLLRERREAAGLTQQGLGAQVGVSRQALIAIEAGRQVPSTALSLQLARALGCEVGDLFRLAPAAGIEAQLAPALHPAASGRPAPSGGRVLLAQVEGRWVAHPLPDDAPTAADGILLGPSPDGGVRATVAVATAATAATAATGPAQSVRVEPLSDLRTLQHSALVAGCAPLLGILAERAGRRYRDARVCWLPANSERALSLLQDGLVHVAGLHLSDTAGGGLPALLRRRLPGRRLLLVNLTCWRQGLLVAPGNPRGIRDVADLLRADVRTVYREPGSGADHLLRQLLAARGLPPQHDACGPLVAGGHAEVAQLVRSGLADVGVAIEGVAIAAGLHFIPLAEERFDLVVPAELAATEPVARVLDVLGQRAYLAEAARLPGYDNALGGQVTALPAA